MHFRHRCPPGHSLQCPRPDRCRCVPKKGAMSGMYDPKQYPEGVPNPFEPMVETYPNYVHGSDYTRPYFAEPWMEQPYNVLEGLGAITPQERRKGVLSGAAVGAAALGLLAAIAVKEQPARAALTGMVLGGLVGVAAAWTAVEVSEASP